MIIALNNKSNITYQEYIKYVDQLEKIESKNTLILCPSSLYLGLHNVNKFHLGAQNVSQYKEGAHTGEIAASQLKSINAKYCIVGHSERRAEQQESSIVVNKKVIQLLENEIIPIMCIGETKEEKEQGKVKEVLTNQIKEGISNINESELSKVIIAYEPIWSIGTGLIPTNEDISEVLSFIKGMLPTSKTLYGGSANEENISVLKNCKEIDGYLLGGLSLKPSSLQNFLDILENN